MSQSQVEIERYSVTSFVVLPYLPLIRTYLDDSKVTMATQETQATVFMPTECTWSLYYVDTTHGSIQYRLPALTNQIAETLLAEAYECHS